MERKKPDRLVILPTKRGMTERQAAEYLGLSLAAFRGEVKRGIWPGPRYIDPRHRKKVWDKRAVDLAYDRISGIGSGGAEDEAAALAALDRWHGAERLKKRPRS